jgi:hypothetical protein
MPGMTGFEFVTRVKAINSEVRVLFMSDLILMILNFSKVLPSIQIDVFIRKPFFANRIAKANLQAAKGYLNNIKENLLIRIINDIYDKYQLYN